MYFRSNSWEQFVMVKKYIFLKIFLYNLWSEATQDYYNYKLQINKLKLDSYYTNIMIQKSTVILKY